VFGEEAAKLGALVVHSTDYVFDGTLDRLYWFPEFERSLLWNDPSVGINLAIRW